MPSQWPVESEDDGLVTTERPVDGSLVIVVSAKTRPLAKARTEADKASVFNIPDHPCCCDTTLGSAHKRRGQTLVPNRQREARQARDGTCALLC